MAGGYLASIKMKRKDLDDVNDNFSDFSLSSPARKIRRLDVELPPIIEEPEIRPLADQQSVAVGSIEEEQRMVDSGLNENQERAIVVFKHVNPHPLLLHSPSNFSVSVDSDFISAFKIAKLAISPPADQYPWSSHSGDMNSAEEEAVTNNNSMAVVPWVPCQLQVARGMDTSQGEAPELMDAEQAGGSAMEIEGNTAETLHQGHEHGMEGMRVNEGLPKWQQQHCLIPQLPYNTFTPISWSY